jgi:hypothetical protein
MADKTPVRYFPAGEVGPIDQLGEYHPGDTIAWSVVNKAGSSLADLATRSASDLSSGTLPTGRIAGAYSGLTGVGTIVSGVWNGTAVDATHGGTAQTAWATGDILYGSGVNTLGRRTIGSSGDVLTVAGGVPTWAAPATGLTIVGTLNRIALTGSSPTTIDIAATYVGQTSITTLGTVTTGVWNGTPIVTTYGGTGLSAWTAGDVPYYASGTALSKLAIGSANKILTTTGTAPQWSTNIAYGAMPTGGGTWANGGDLTFTGGDIIIPSGRTVYSSSISWFGGGASFNGAGFIGSGGLMRVGSDIPIILYNVVAGSPTQIFSVLQSGIAITGAATSTGATNFEWVFPNNKYFRGTNAANTTAYGIAAVNTSDKISFDLNARGSVFGAGAVFTGALSGITTLGMSSTLTMSAAASKIVPGATSLSFRNNADSADNLLIADAGGATFRTSVTVGSSLVFTTAASKIIPGATSLSHRNNADSADNLIITDAGVSTFRSNMVMGTNNATFSGTKATAVIGNALELFRLNTNDDMEVFGQSATTGKLLKLAHSQPSLTTAYLGLGNDVWIRDGSYIISNNGTSGRKVIRYDSTNNSVQIGDGGQAAQLVEIANGFTSLGATTLITLGKTGGSGPATAAQNSWLKIKANGGNSYFIPLWQ